LNPTLARCPSLTIASILSLQSVKSAQIISTRVEFVDIAGLVRGASKGEGLGNQFLGNIRVCDAIVHVVRCFENDDIIHVEASIDPVRDIEIITLELALSDLSQVDRRIDRTRKAARADADAKVELAALEKVRETLDAGKPARLANLTDEEKEAISVLQLLTLKPTIYAANVSEDDLATGNAFVDKVKAIAASENAEVTIVSAQVESELLELPDDERQDFLEALGVKEGGLRSLIRATYHLLGLRTYFTVGPKEARAWTIHAGMKAPQAAGVIHSDFEKAFIRAETVAFKDLVDCGSMSAARSKGLLRSEGKEYVVQEGDVILFLTSA
jgi:ribosome-binding ATPase